jgi:hypothetical protein
VGGLTCRKKERETILLADRINWIWECAIKNTNKSKLGRIDVLVVKESGYDASLFIKYKTSRRGQSFCELIPMLYLWYKKRLFLTICWESNMH